MFHAKWWNPFSSSFPSKQQRQDPESGLTDKSRFVMKNLSLKMAVRDALRFWTKPNHPSLFGPKSQSNSGWSLQITLFPPRSECPSLQGIFPLTGTHQKHPLPAPAPACLGTLRLCGSKDDQVWECCSLTFTMCAPAAGSVPVAEPQAGSGWLAGVWLLLGPPSPSLPPALSFTHHTGRKSIPWELETNSTLPSCCTDSRFQSSFLEG